MKILFVDDTDDKYKSIKGRITDYLAHETIFATGPDQTMEKLKLQPDLVFIDQKMPVVSGLELGERISQLPEYRHIPLVMLTAYDHTEFAVPALTTKGFSYFIAKHVFAGNRIDEELTFIEALPGVQIKRQLKDLEGAVKYYTEKINEEKKKTYIKNWRSQFTTDKEETLELVKKRLTIQEEILKMIRTIPMQLPNMYNVSGGMMLLEKGKPVDIEILKKLSNLKKHKEQALKGKKGGNSYNTFKVFFKLREKDLFTQNALLVMGLITSENQWPYTVSMARKKNRLKDTRFYTFIDEIVEELDK